MRVKLITIMAGPGGSYDPGLAELPDDVAKDLIKSGYAEAIEEVVETASIEPPKKAVKPKAQPRRGNKK